MLFVLIFLQALAFGSEGRDVTMPLGPDHGPTIVRTRNPALRCPLLSLQLARSLLSGLERGTGKRLLRTAKS